jgi:protoheme IX farnesyltransferase
MSAKERNLKNLSIDRNGNSAVVEKAFDFVALMKPRVMSLSVFTSFVGMMIAPVTLAPFTALIAMVAIALGAGGAGALNMWYDAEIDAVMSRTSSRPVPAGRLSSGQALGFGVLVSVFSVATLAVATNMIAAALLAFTIFFYAVVYTMWLKHSTPQNIVIGGAAGAIPPMIGWAAATGTIGIESSVLFLIIFLWTPPHFWALALFKSGDYENARIPMMPIVAGFASTRKQMFVYALLLAPVGVLPWVIGPASVYYGFCAAVLGVWFVWRAYRVLATVPDDRSMASEKKLFAFSILYLFLVFGALLCDSVIFRAIATISA